MGTDKIQAPPERVVIKPRSIRFAVSIALFALVGIALIGGGVCFAVFQLVDDFVPKIMFACGVMVMGYFGFWLFTTWGSKIYIGTRAVISRERVGGLTLPMTVCYYEICDIVLVKKVGRKKSVTIGDETILRPCIVFDCVNGDKTEIGISYYGKAQIIKILDLILERAAQSGNRLNCRSGQEIYDNALSA